MILIYLIFAYFVTEMVLRKLLTIQSYLTFSYPHYSRIFQNIERVTFIIFLLAILLTLIQFQNDTRLYAYSFTLLFLLQFIKWCIRGAEQWIYAPMQKDYIFSWMGAGLMFLYACIFYFL